MNAFAVPVGMLYQIMSQRSSLLRYYVTMKLQVFGCLRSKKDNEDAHRRAPSREIKDRGNPEPTKRRGFHNTRDSN